MQNKKKKILKHFETNLNKFKSSNNKYLENLVKNLTTKKSFNSQFVQFLKNEDYFSKNSRLFVRNYNLKKNFLNILLSNLKYHLLKIRIIAKIMANIDPSLVFSKDLKDSKFTKTNKKEIREKLQLISKFDNSKDKFKVQDLNGHMFKISRLN